MTGTLFSHVAAGQAVKFAIDQRSKLLESRLIAVPPVHKHLSDLLLRKCPHTSSPQLPQQYHISSERSSDTKKCRGVQITLALPAANRAFMGVTSNRDGSHQNRRATTRAEGNCHN